MTQLSPEGGHLYARELDPDGQDSLAKIARLIHPGSRVLDLGCGPGALGRYLREALDCTVDGVELDPQSLLQARPYYRRLESLDLEQVDLKEHFGAEYDVIVCADVLEHLRDPGRVVDDLLALLSPGGRLLLSIPNVAYSGLVLGLLAGEFDYGPEGLLDETHLRFFTRKSLLAFLERHGLVAGSLDVVTVDLRDSEFRSHYLDALPPALARSLLARPDAWTYQFIVEALPRAGAGEGTAAVVGDHSPGPPPELRFGAQLYWRCVDGHYQEPWSVHGFGRLGDGHQRLSFDIPPLERPLTGLRLDPADRPGLLHLHAIRLYGHDRLLWQWDGRRASLEQGPSRQLAFSDALGSGAAGVTLLLTGDDPQMELPLQLDAPLSLDSGARLEVELGWPMSLDALAVARECVPARDAREERRNLQDRIEAWERQSGELQGQLQAQQDQVGELRQQLTRRQQQLREQAYREETLTEQLTARQEEVRVLTSQLQEREGSLIRQQQETATLQATLAEIQGSTIWRWSRPYVKARVALARWWTRPRAAVPASRPRPRDLVVDVIVPVYRGLEETRDCLESLLADQVDQRREVVVIDDASPQPEVSAFLRRLADQGRITLLVNEHNLGFVATVNRGMSLHPQRDVVLLNSDTRVNGDWLDRLVDCAYQQPNVGTATPFSNNATICNYPDILRVNALPRDTSLEALDGAVSRANPGASVEIPTAVGFCMYIRRDCLDQVGLFDVANFGRGYGEENDFSMRAVAAGWKHLLCADTFVYHSGGVSFAETEHPQRTAAVEKMRQLHPQYETRVVQHYAQDPARPLRLRVDALRLRSSPRPRVLFILHASGGGTEKHVRELAQLLSDAMEVLLLLPVKEGWHQLRWLRSGETMTLHLRLPRDYRPLVRLLQGLGIRRLHFHHLQGVDTSVFGLAADLGVPYDVTVHDYYLACPQVTFTTARGRYCGEPDESGCRTCLRIQPAPGGVDISTWRKRHGELVEGAERVLVPSGDVARRLARYFPQAPLVVAPHPEEGMATLPPPLPPPLHDDEKLRIVVLGALSPVKGPDLLERCALDARQRGLPLEFHLLGYAYRQLTQTPASRLVVHGPYQEADLEERLGEIDPHLAWFPALCPETYSYTLSACLRAGLPVVAPDLGAFGSRLAGRSWSWIGSWEQGPKAWNDFFAALRSRHFATGVAPEPLPGQPERAEFDYRRDYLQGLEATETDTGIDETEVLEQVARWAYPWEPDQPPRQLRRRGAAHLLPLIRQLRAAPSLRWLVRNIPLSWQTRFKYWLLGHPRA